MVSYIIRCTVCVFFLFVLFLVIVIILIIIAIMSSLDNKDNDHNEKDCHDNNEGVEKQTVLALQITDLCTVLDRRFFWHLCIFCNRCFFVAHIGAILQIVLIQSVHTILVDCIDETVFLIPSFHERICNAFSFYINCLRSVTCWCCLIHLLRCCNNISILGLKADERICLIRRSLADAVPRTVLLILIDQIDESDIGTDRIVYPIRICFLPKRNLT